MASSRRRSRPVNYEERYLSLRDEHEALKRKFADAVDKLKKTTTQYRQLEKKVATVRPSAITSGKSDRELERLAQELRHQNEQLQQRNLELTRENHALQMYRMRRDDIETIKGRPVTGSGRTRRPASSGASRRSPSASRRSARDDHKPPQTAPGSGRRSAPAGTDRQRELIAALRERLEAAERGLRAAEDENAALREEMRTAVADAAPMGTEADSIALQRQLADAQAQLTLLRSRLEHVQARADASREVQERTLQEADDQARQARDLRARLRAAERAAGDGEGVRRRVAALEEEARAAREEARAAEEKLTSLCESPFMSDALERRERVERLRAQEQQLRQQKLRVDYLQQHARQRHAEVKALTEQLAAARRERDEAVAANQAAQLQLQEASRGQRQLRDQVALFTGDGGLGVDMADLERALGIVRRQRDRPSEAGVLADRAGAGLEGEAGLRRQLQEAQLALLAANRDLERSERMLRAQTAINRDLNAEVSDAQAARERDAVALRQRLADFETLADKRLQRAQALEAQNQQLLDRLRAYAGAVQSVGDARASAAVLAGSGRQLAVGVGGGGGVAGLLPPGAYPLGAGEGPAQHGALLSELGPGENVVEVCVVSLRLDPTRVNRRVCTFVIAEFYDCKASETPLVTGLAPTVQFAFTYHVEMNTFFVRHLAIDALQLELYKAEGGAHHLLGRCAVPLRSLLDADAPHGVRVVDAPFVSMADGTSVGTVTLEMALALPVGDALRAFLDHHPEEEARMHRLAAQDQEASRERAAIAAAQNQIVVTIESAVGLRSRHGGVPSPSVAYNLPGYPHVMTTVVPDTTEPRFDAESTFPLPTDEATLGALARHTLELLVLDDADREPSARGVEGLLGTARVPLAALARGGDVRGAFEVRDEADRPVGAVRISARWRDALAVADFAGPGFLTDRQVRGLCELFATQGRDGAVRWTPFLRLVHPLPAARAVRARLRTALSALAADLVRRGEVAPHAVPETAGPGGPAPSDLLYAPDAPTEAALEKVVTALSEAAGGRAGILSPEALARGMKRGLGWSVTENEAAALARAARGASGSVLQPSPLPAASASSSPRTEGAGDAGGRGATVSGCSPEDVAAFLRPAPPALRAVEAKLVAFADNARGRGVDMRSEFEQRDAGGGGLVSRAQFRAALIACGLRIADDSFAAGSGARDPRAEADWTTGDAPKSPGASDEHTSAPGAPVPPLRVPQTHGPSPREVSGRSNRSRHTSSARGDDEEGDLSHRVGVGGVVQAADEVGDAFSDRSRAATRAGPSGQEEAKVSAAAAVDVHAAAQSEPDAVLEAEDALLAALGAEHAAGSGAQGGDPIETCRGVFTSLDADNSGTLSRAEFVRALVRLGVQVSAVQGALLARVFDADGDGNIAWTEFLEWARSTLVHEASNAGGAAERVRRQLAGTGARAALEAMDVDGDGAVTADEAVEALSARGIAVNAEAIAQLWAMVDESGTGALGRSELRALSRPALEDVQEAVGGVVRRARDKGGVSLRDSFKHFDENGDGRIERGEFTRGVRGLGLELSALEREAVFERFATADGTILYADFCDFVADCQQAEDQDNKSLLRLQRRLAAAWRLAQAKGISVAKAFTVYDPEATGRIAGRAFARAVRRLGCVCTSHELALAAANFASDHAAGGVDYKRFLRWARPNMGEVAGLARDLRSAALAAFPHPEIAGDADWESVWKTFDRSGDDEVTRRELRTGLHKLGLRWTDSEARTLMETLDRDGSGRVGRDEFVRFARELGGTMDEHAGEASSDAQPRHARPSAPADRDGGRKGGRGRSQRKLAFESGSEGRGGGLSSRRSDAEDKDDDGSRREESSPRSDIEADVDALLISLRKAARKASLSGRSVRSTLERAGRASSETGRDWSGRMDVAAVQECAVALKVDRPSRRVAAALLSRLSPTSPRSEKSSVDVATLLHAIGPRRAGKSRARTDAGADLRAAVSLDPAVVAEEALRAHLRRESGWQADQDDDAERRAVARAVRVFVPDGGRVRRADVIPVLRAAGVSDADGVAAEVFAALDLNGGGAASAGEVAVFLHDSAFSDVEVAIRRALLRAADEDARRSRSRRDSSDLPTRVQAAFTSVGGDSRGVPRRHLRQALGKLGVSVSDEVAARLGRRLDLDADGTVSAEELASFLKPSESTVDRDILLVGRVRRELRTHIESNVGSRGNARKEVESVFAEVDTDRSGRVDTSELRQALGRLGVQVDAREASQLVETMAGGRASGIDIDDFVEFVTADTATGAQERQSPRVASRPPSARRNDGDRPTVPRSRPGSARREIRTPRNAQPGGEDAMETDRVVATLSRKVEQAAMERSIPPAQAAGQLFDIMDRNKSGALDDAELAKGLRALRVVEGGTESRVARLVLERVARRGAPTVSRDAWSTFFADRSKRPPSARRTPPGTSRTDTSSCASSETGGPRAAVFSRPCSSAEPSDSSVVVCVHEAAPSGVNSSRDLASSKLCVRFKLLERKSQKTGIAAVSGGRARLDTWRVFPLDDGTEAKELMEDALTHADDPRASLVLRLLSVSSDGTQTEVGTGALSLGAALDTSPGDMVRKAVKIYRAGGLEEVATITVTIKGLEMLRSLC